MVQGCTDAPIDADDYLVDELFVVDALGGVSELACEAAIALALTIPDFFLAPVIELSEELKEEYSKIFCFVFWAEVDSWYDALKDLPEEAQEVEVRDA